PAHADLRTAEPLPLPESHLAEGRLDAHLEAVRRGDDRGRGASPLERARVDRAHDGARQRVGERLALASAARRERDVARARAAAVAGELRFSVPYGEQLDRFHNRSILSYPCDATGSGPGSGSAR